jgi:Spy/CpxP family protein refolding chaperone
MKISRLTPWTAALAVAGILLAGLAFTAVAQEEPERGFFGPRMMGPPGMHGGGEFVPRRMLRQLDLTDEQLNQLRELRKTHFEQTQTEREALMKAREAFHEAVQNGVEADIRQAAQTMAQAEADLAIARLGFRDEFLQILTPEQQEKLKELQAEMKTFREKRLERRKKFQ